jgi:hypothetical protein
MQRLWLERYLRIGTGNERRMKPGQVHLRKIPHLPCRPGVTAFNPGSDDLAYGAAVWQSGTSGTRFVVAGAAVNSGHSTFNTTLAGFPLGGVVTLDHVLSTQWHTLTDAPRDGGVSVGQQFRATTYCWSAVYVDAMIARDESDNRHAATSEV